MTALTKPIPSPPGYFTDYYGATVATPRPVGRYQNMTGQGMQSLLDRSLSFYDGCHKHLPVLTL